MNLFDRPQIVIEQKQFIKQEKRCTFTIVSIRDTIERGRLDAEYWISQNKLNSIRGSIEFKTLRELEFDVKFGTTPAGGEFLESGIPFIRSQNFNYECIGDDYVYCDEEFYNSKKISNVQAGDVLIAAVGATIGEVAIIQDTIPIAAINQNIARVRNGLVKQEYLLMFLKTKYGQNQLMGENTGNVQPYLNTEKILNLKLPLLTPTFQAKIEETVKTAHKLLEQSKTAYKTAEKLLLGEVFGLWKPTMHKNWHIKMLGEVQSAQRMDAEYFHPKYEELIGKIKAYRGGWCRLGEVCEVKDKGFTPIDDQQYNYIELSSIDNNGNVNEITKDLGKNLPSRARRLVAKNDVIISSVEGSLDKVALIVNDDTNLLCSTGFYVVNSQKFLPQVLFMLAKSSICQTQFKRGCGGAILSAFPKDCLNNAVLPLLPQSLQTEIATLVQKSFDDRTQSKTLLQLAKTAVEMAIEEGEEAVLQNQKLTFEKKQI